ncbi:M48 family metallopeptidase [Arthrobacter echini]|uniref:M48 metallopeptidase family protein n=1 Tax=Arthrobacter echini TaxID=1529066 RepID=UPI001FE3D2AF|nr:M48 family metallopeptidase [Arthrobacter echini]
MTTPDVGAGETGAEETREADDAGFGRLPVQVHRSARRRRTVSADIRDGVVRVLIPGHFSAREERQWVERMVERMEAKYAAAAIRGNEPVPELLERAGRLSREYLDGGAVPSSITWVTNQNSRWASATPSRGTIRLSHKLQGMPEWVVDYVILHELAHLIEPSHSAAFWALLSAYPRTETAKAFLDGASFAFQRSVADDRDSTLDSGQGPHPGR